MVAVEHLFATGFPVWLYNREAHQSCPNNRRHLLHSSFLVLLPLFLLLGSQILGVLPVVGFGHEHLPHAILRYGSRDKTSTMVQPCLDIFSPFEKSANAVQCL